MAFDPAGNLLVGTRASAVYRYPASGGTIAPAATPPAPLLTGLNQPTSVAFHAGWLYVGETTRITRYRYDPAGPLGAPEVVVPDLPEGGHNTRTVSFGPDGKLYVAVGSSCNLCDESDERRAAVLRYEPDGSGYRRVASGLRNPVGLSFQPGTGALWAAVNERDRQGNEIPPDLVTRVAEGANYGWPNCLPPDATPQEAGASCAGITAPTIAIQAHSAPLGLAFAQRLALPAPYREGLFVAQHGSWNRTPPTAPKLLHVAFDAQGNPIGVKDFVSGWQDGSGARWGRPVGVVPAPDGSLIVSDDQGGLLFRITGG
jgi:glucose/arabinose dehydrogenase